VGHQRLTAVSVATVALALSTTLVVARRVPLVVDFLDWQPRPKTHGGAAATTTGLAVTRLGYLLNRTAT
jgi:hypothetical protein